MDLFLCRHYFVFLPHQSWWLLRWRSVLLRGGLVPNWYHCCQSSITDITLYTSVRLPTLLYFSIGFNLWRLLVKTPASSFGNSHSSKRMIVEVTIMLIVSVVVSALCWLPQHVALFINFFMTDICHPEFVWFGKSRFAYSNSAMNPITYVVFYSEKRKHLTDYSFKGLLGLQRVTVQRSQCKWS